MALFATNVYRGATQPMTIDEAYTFNVHVDYPFEHLLTIYDANHHVLHTILCWISVRSLGLSEFSLRLPSLLGGLLYLVTTLRMCRYAFGDGWFGFLSFALLSTSPALLDYMSAARGYGPGLAFFTWALYHAMIYFTERTESSIEKVAIGLALAAASNLIYVFPGVALGIMLAIRLVRDGKGWSAVDRLVVPGIVVAFTILALPLSHAGQSNYYFGAKDLITSVTSVISIAWWHEGGLDLNNAQTFLEMRPWIEIGLPTVLLLAAICSRAQKGAAGALLALSAGSLAGSVALLAAAHTFPGLPYPLLRTGLYWIPLLLWTCVLLIHSVWNGKRRLAAVPLLAAAILSVIQFSSQFSLVRYSGWIDERAGRPLVQAIRRHHAAHPGSSAVRIGAITWQLEPSLNFYRRMYRLDWMELVDRNATDAGRDYYVALPADARKLDSFSLTRIYEEPETHAILAARVK